MATRSDFAHPGNGDDSGKNRASQASPASGDGRAGPLPRPPEGHDHAGAGWRPALGPDGAAQVAEDGAGVEETDPDATLVVHPALHRLALHEGLEDVARVGR